jgi:ammonium transporter Rh
MGGSMYVHTFGAYFGIACSIALTNKDILKKSEKYEKGNYNSQLIAMIGTLFLWCYWPSFNGVFA